MTRPIFLPLFAVLSIAACAKSPRPSDAVTQAGSARAADSADTSRPATAVQAPQAAAAAAPKVVSSPVTKPVAEAVGKGAPAQAGANVVAVPAPAVAHPPAPAPTVDTSHAAAPASLPAAAPAVASSATTSDVADSLGKPAYQENCRKCHGVRGVAPKTIQAKYPKIPAFDAAFDTRVSADSIVTVLVRGVNDDMKSFKDKLTHEQMVALAAYVRQLAK